MNDLPALITVYYLGILGFLLGWAMPRGKYLKLIQRKLLKALYNFFVDEKEYIQKKVRRVIKKG